MSEHDAHTTFIKTPQQLILVVLLSFLVPIIGIILLVQLATTAPSIDPGAMAPEKVAARIQPVGRIELGGAAAAPGARSGEQIVKTTCAACHQAGVANAPKMGDKAAWAPRLKQGVNGLVQSALKGKGAMPPKGGDASLNDTEVRSAVVYMANLAGAGFKEAAAPKQAASAAAAPSQPAAAPTQAAAPAKGAASAQAAAAPAGKADGKKVFDSTCMACHATGVANAPKLGDKAAWAPRLKQGTDALVQSALKGKGAMPPKGGNAALSEAEVRAAVEFMASQAK